MALACCHVCRNGSGCGRVPGIEHHNPGKQAGSRLCQSAGVYLLSRPQLLGLVECGRQQFDTALPVCQAPVHQLCVVVPGEEAAAQRHSGAGHHVVLDQARQGLAVLEGVRHKTLFTQRRWNIAIKTLQHYDAFCPFTQNQLSRPLLTTSTN